MMDVHNFIKLDDNFVDITKFKGKIKKLNCIDGAMLLTINYVDVIDISMWDSIDQLWIYILNALIDFNEGNDVDFCFPDQPIKVIIKHVKNNVFFKVEESGVMVNKKQFMLFMASSCLDFLKQLMAIEGAPDYGSEIKLALHFIENLTS
ncbi:hypothetical protein JHU04_001114 [Brenneria sp. 4F2]|nr:hypothetical protein [Brenneria bubanii]